MGNAKASFEWAAACAGQGAWQVEFRVVQTKLFVCGLRTCSTLAALPESNLEENFKCPWVTSIAQTRITRTAPAALAVASHDLGPNE